MPENRVFPRIPVKLKVTCKSEDSLSLPCRGMSEDLSQGGLLFKAPVHIRMSPKLQGEIHLPSQEEPIRFKANLVWRKLDGGQSKNGLQFIDMKSADKKRLEDFLKSVWTQMLTVY